MHHFLCTQETALLMHLKTTWLAYKELACIEKTFFFPSFRDSSLHCNQTSILQLTCIKSIYSALPKNTINIIVNWLSKWEIIENISSSTPLTRRIIHVNSQQNLFHLVLSVMYWNTCFSLLLPVLKSAIELFSVFVFKKQESGQRGYSNH